MTDKPNPGSDEARAAGCICAVIDNNRGKFPPFPACTGRDGEVFPDAWYVTVGCPVHSPYPKQGAKA